MQGQRGTFGSLPETFFDHGSTSSNAAVDQQVCCNNIRNPIENRLPDYLLSPNDMNIGYVNSIGTEEQELGRWSLGEPCSSGTRSEVSLNHNEQKIDNRWPSSMNTYANAGPRLEEQHYGHNSLFDQSSNSHSVPQNLSSNASSHGDNNGQVTEPSNLYKPSGSGDERSSPGAGANAEAFSLSSGSSGYVVNDNDRRPGPSFEGRRASCKRKALEGNVGQSSSSGSSSYFHRAESSARRGASAFYGAENSVNIYAPTRQEQPRLGLDGRGSASGRIPEQVVLPTTESSQRNFRLRINSSSIPEPISPPIFSTADTPRQTAVSSSQQSSRSLPADHSMDLRTETVVDNPSIHNPNVVYHVPTLQQNVQTFRWNGGSGSRTGGSSSSNVSGDRDAVPREGRQSRSMARNLLDNPIFIPAPELRTVRNPTNRGLNSGNISVPGNVPPTSRAGSSSGANRSSSSTMVPPHNPSPQFPRRLSELVRQSLISTLGSESGGQGNHSSLSSGRPTSQEEMLISSGVANQGQHHPYPRSMAWLERQDAGLLGIPHPLRTLAAASEGRSRLVVSEIRNVLDLMRRGENLRFEDVMILEQPVFLGVADIHDRHRDMRLDVDNMSYEELLALEERIGNVSTGLSEETISNRLKRRKHYSVPGAQLEVEEPCCVCQEEYNDGEDLGVLECGHEFHADCINKWLMLKNLCPICKTMGLTK